MERASLGRIVRIARVEITVAWRAFRKKNRIQQGVLGVAMGFGLIALAAVIGAAFVTGTTVAAGQTPRPVKRAGLLSAALFVGTVAFSTYLTAVQYGDSNILEGLLTSVPYQDVALGLLIATFAQIGIVFLFPLIGAALAFGLGAGDPVSAVLSVAAVLVVFLPAYTVGFGAGLTVKHLFGQSPLLVRYRTPMGVSAFLGYLALLVTGSIDRVFQPVLDIAGNSPVAWAGDLALLSLGVGASPVQASAALLGGMLLGALGLLATVWGGEALWYTDPVETGGGRIGSVQVRGLSALMGREAAWVTMKSWLRARRAPLKVIYVVYPAVVLIEPVQSSLEAGSVAISLPALVAVYGAWMTGAAFGLNPLGDEGAVLPITVLTGVRGRVVVRGLMAAGLVPGLPVTVAVTAALAWASPLDPVAAVGMTVGAAALCVAATGIGVGVGTAFPRYDAASLTRSRSVVVPSTWAFLSYTVIVTVLAAPATVLQVPAVHRRIEDIAGVGTGTVQLSGLAVALVLVTLAALLGTRFGARRFDEYRLD